MPIENGASAAIANLIGANNQLAPNPMGGFYGGMLMNQEQGNSALNQEEQSSKNAALLEAVKQAQAVTPAIQAKAALDTQGFNLDKQVDDQHGLELRTSKTKDAILEHYTKMNENERKKMDEHLDDAERASDMIKAYGNGDAKEGMKFVKSNPKAMQHINEVLSRNGAPGLDENDPFALEHTIAAGQGSIASRKQRQDLAKVALENQGKLADAQERSRGLVEAAGVTAGAVKSQSTVIAQLQREAQQVGGIQNLDTPQLQQLITNIKLETDKNPPSPTLQLEEYNMKAISDPAARAAAQDKWDAKRYGDEYMTGIQALRARKPGGEGAGTGKGAAAPTGGSGAGSGPNSGLAATQKSYLEKMRKNNPGISDDVLIKGLKDKGYW